MRAVFLFSGDKSESFEVFFHQLRHQRRISAHDGGIAREKYLFNFLWSV
jgi:hypothetical protein